jgi:glutamate transport system substrate-binding protein
MTGGARVTRGRWTCARAVLVVVLASAGCALDGATPTSVVGRRSLTIGVKADQPSLGFRRPRDGRYEGFDVDVAVYVAGRLGVPRERITFRPTPSSIRERALRDGSVDLVFATYSITAKRKTQVTFGGPYYVPHQDTLVRADDRSITNVRDLRGRRLCAVTGSNSWRRVTEERGIAATVVEAPTYSACVDGLVAGRLDAVSTDDPFTDEKYGVGLRRGDLDGCEAVNRAVTRMYQDGTAARLLDKWFGASGLTLNGGVPQFEGCA